LLAFYSKVWLNKKTDDLKNTHVSGPYRVCVF
jgi:hypothetical protein